MVDQLWQNQFYKKKKKLNRKMKIYQMKSQKSIDTLIGISDILLIKFNTLKKNQNFFNIIICKFVNLNIIKL